MANQSIISLPPDIEDPVVLKRFLARLVEQLDIVFGNKAGPQRQYVDQDQLNKQTSSTDLINKIAAGIADTAVSDHVALTDPHTQYTQTADLATVATSGSYGDLSGIADNLELKRYNETVATGSATLDRADGGIQTFTMTANITLAVTIAAGESLTFHLSAGNTYAVTWPTMTWVGGSAPALTAADVIEFWKIGSTLYGAYVGAI